MVKHRQRHQRRVGVLKVAMAALLVFHVTGFEEYKVLYGPTVGNARTLLAHTLTWMVAVPFYTTPLALSGWVVDGWMANAGGRRTKVWTERERESQERVSRESVKKERDFQEREGLKRERESQERERERERVSRERESQERERESQERVSRGVCRLSTVCWTLPALLL